MYKIVKSSEGTIRKIADTKSANNLITKDISPNFSLATTEAVNHYEEETTEYDRIYYVLDGKMGLIINNDEYELNSGDSCYIDKGSKYIMQGTFKERKSVLQRLSQAVLTV
jgi:ethanolamine utilization protein EutQ (cupin superfamily)